MRSLGEELGASSAPATNGSTEAPAAPGKKRGRPRKTAETVKPDKAAKPAKKKLAARKAKKTATGKRSLRAMAAEISRRENGHAEIPRFGVFSDGSVQVDAPSCKGILQPEEAKELVAFIGRLSGGK